MGKFWVQPLGFWAEYAPPPLPGWNRVKVSENLGATVVVPVTTAECSMALFDLYDLLQVSKKNDDEKTLLLEIIWLYPNK